MTNTELLTMIEIFRQETLERNRAVPKAIVLEQLHQLAMALVTNNLEVKPGAWDPTGEQNLEPAGAVEKPMQAMKDFLDQVLHVMEPADQIYFVDRGLMAATIDRYDRALLDWENAPAMIKTLFYFLTQSDYSGPHREAFEAYLLMSYDFIKQSDPGVIASLSN